MATDSDYPPLPAKASGPMEVRARRKSLPATLKSGMAKRRCSSPEIENGPQVSESFENLVFGRVENGQCYPEWLKTCNLLRWLLDSGLGRWLRSSTLVSWLQTSDLGLWLGSHCPALTNLLLLKVTLWLILVWILADLHLGLPCFLLALTYWLYEGPLRRAVNRARSQLQGRAQAVPENATGTVRWRREAPRSAGQGNTGRGLPIIGLQNSVCQ
ncbi:hypothetical protein J4Q44_G00227800 [Coregonus suidteri]|uniref:Uncharacterized protein n=1 Tax=Coregonus suidteri TaxID=861788 RepID=A0AAN8LFN4_9TELE